MESKIETLIKESISLSEHRFNGDSTIQNFERSKNEFKELIKKGLTQERGNNLLSISDIKSSSKVVFNYCQA